MTSSMTTEQLAALEALLAEARQESSAGRAAAAKEIAAGDVVQLRPGASYTWETSLMLVQQNDGRRIRGQILRPHRGGCRDAWASHTAPELIRIGRIPFPEPAQDIRAWCYTPPCSRMATPEEAASYRREREAAYTALRAEQIEIERKEASRRRQAALRAHGKKTEKKNN